MCYRLQVAWDPRHWTGQGVLQGKQAHTARLPPAGSPSIATDQPPEQPPKGAPWIECMKDACHMLCSTCRCAFVIPLQCDGGSFGYPQHPVTAVTCMLYILTGFLGSTALLHHHYGSGMFADGTFGSCLQTKDNMNRLLMLVGDVHARAAARAAADPIPADVPAAVSNGDAAASAMAAPEALAEAGDHDPGDGAPEPVAPKGRPKGIKKGLCPSAEHATLLFPPCKRVVLVRFVTLKNHLAEWVGVCMLTHNPLQLVVSAVSICLLKLLEVWQHDKALRSCG